MIWLGLLVLGGNIAVAIWGRIFWKKEKGKYSRIQWFLRQSRKKNWIIPEWIQAHMIFRTWILLVAGSGFLVAGELFYQVRGQDVVTELKRPEYGRGSVQEELSMEWEKKNGRKEKREILVEVEEKKLTEEEISEMFQKVKKELDDRILGANKSADQVNDSLYLPETVADFPVFIQWFCSEPGMVDGEGNLGENIPEKGKLVCLTAILTLEEKEEKYFKYVKIYPPIKTEEEELEGILKKTNKEDSYWMKLPGIFRGKKILWKMNRKNDLLGFAILIFVCPVLLLVRDKQVFREEEKREKQQMVQDYPEILNKLTLLMGAGVNLRKAMERIGGDYKRNRENKEKRKAYEMILEICQEMERGVSEKRAYEKLGEKCGVLYYKTLSALLVQHLQKGSRDMGRILEEEAGKAQEIRRQQARILGEQASTKLLIPMILMLLVVFIILVVPAWLTFTL